VTKPRTVLFCNVAQPVSRATDTAVVDPTKTGEVSIKQRDFIISVCILRKTNNTYNLSPMPVQRCLVIWPLGHSRPGLNRGGCSASANAMIFNKQCVPGANYPHATSILSQAELADSTSVRRGTCGATFRTGTRSPQDSRCFRLCGRDRPSYQAMSGRMLRSSFRR
jgi:hypothetical protein